MAPRLEDLLADVVALADPVARFRALADLDDRPRELASLIRAERTRCVLEIRNRADRPSWTAVGEVLGISGERARQLATDTTKESVTT